jgi:8-oxo-dGTP pyrophosphatase MutT (NUDIX family)
MVAGDGSGALDWKVMERRQLLECRIFTVADRLSQGPDGRQARFMVVETGDWVNVVPILHRDDGDYFLMVRQYRHGMEAVCMEFPGGMVDPGETPEEAAHRELLEETGFRAGRLRHAGTMSPNPAIMDNSFHVYVADMLEGGHQRDLDENEILDALVIPVEEVRARMGEAPYSHALMATALFLADRLPS